METTTNHDKTALIIFVILCLGVMLWLKLTDLEKKIMANKPTDVSNLEKRVVELEDCFEEI